MKYYKIKLQRNFENDMIATNACGDYVEKGELYFRQIEEELLLESPPVFDYFFLKSFDKKKYWEWILCDVHRFIGGGSRMNTGSFFVSPLLKELLESVKLAKPYLFYPSKLKYKGVKVGRYIFHYFGEKIIEEKMTYVDFQSSSICCTTNNRQVQIKDITEYLKVDEEIGEATDYDNGLKVKKLMLKDELDLYFIGYIGCGMIASDRFRKKVESEGIIGFEFHELDYEVVVKSEA